MFGRRCEHVVVYADERDAIAFCIHFELAVEYLRVGVVIVFAFCLHVLWLVCHSERDSVETEAT